MTFRTPARTAFSFSVALIFLVATSLLAQHLTAPQQSQVARLVHDMIEQTHISQKPITVPDIHDQWFVVREFTQAFQQSLK